jgi:hypothetical protein
MKKRRGARVLLAVFLLMCLVLPASVAYAETPLSLGVVAASAGADGLGSPFQHHSFVADGIMWVFYQGDAVDQILCSWSDDGTTWVAHAPITWCEATTAETVGGQFDTWYYVADDTVRFAVVNTSLNNSDIMYASYDVDAVAHTLTIEGDWRTAVEGVANVSYRNPTICVNNNESVFITYGYVENAVSDVYLTTTNESTDATWVPEVNFPMFNFSANASRPSMYGSVIPLYTSLTNVSIQFAGYNGSEYKIYQTNINWNGSEWVDETGISGIDSSDWYLPSLLEWNYNAVSIDTAINDDDVAIQCAQTDGSEYRVFFNRRGNESDIWASTYAKDFGEGGWTSLYVGAMGIRNAIYSLVYSGWDMEALSTRISSNDFDAITGDWDGIAAVDTDVNIPLVSTMSDYRYDPAGTGYIGFLYGTTTDDNLMYGLYGPAPTPAASSIPASVTAMAWIIILVFGMLICLILMAYGATSSNGNTELIKAGLTGFLGFVIAAIIVAATLV